MRILDNYLKELNEKQLKAVTTTEGYVRVIAGAGSGKTKALTSRYVYLVKELGISTANILCVTFTNKAANEMKSRIRSLIGDLDTGYICTFHGFCVKVLREDIHALNYPKDFMIIDSDDDTKTILNKVYEESNLTSSDITYKRAKKIINFFKYENMNYYISCLTDTDNSKIKEMYQNANNAEDKIIFGYLYEQKKCFALDFDDLINFAVYIFDNFKEKRLKWQNRMEYVMVDEFQDVGIRQNAIAEIVSGIHKNLFIVGDPDQTIYSWRGASVDIILNFTNLHPDATDIIMDINYRSASDIIYASNSLIDKNKNRFPKQLVPLREKIQPVVYYHSKTVWDEGKWIAEQIKKIVENGRKYDDIAILYRSHFVSRSVEEALLRNKIPYTIYSGIEFYNRREIKDVLSYLRMLVYKDDVSFSRIINVPRRNFGKKRMRIITDYAEEHSCSLYESLLANMGNSLIKNSGAISFVDFIEEYSKIYEGYRISDLINEVLVNSGYEEYLRLSGDQDRLDNVSELKNSIYQFENTAGEETDLTEYLQNITLLTNMDSDEKKQCVKLMTIHNAKGLEFLYVFICGLNEGIFPNRHANTLEKLEEERRLAYVAFTRARNVLFISESEGYNFDGMFRYPSRFIFNTDTAFVEYTVELEDEIIKSASEYISTNERIIMNLEENSFRVGDRIIHKAFGAGVIEEIDKESSCYVIQFDSLDTKRSISMSANIVKEQIDI